MKRRPIFYRWLGRIFWLSAAAVTGYTWYYMDQVVPDRVSIIENEEEEFSSGLPLKATIFSDGQGVAPPNESNIPTDQVTISGRDHFSMLRGEKRSYQVSLRLFGIIKLKGMQVDVVDTRYAIPCGSPINTYLKSDGVTVIGAGRIMGSDGTEVKPAYGILKSGDYIEAFSGKPMNTKEDLVRAVNESRDQDCVLQVRREGEDVDISLKPIQGADGQYKLGAWIRDDTQGIGTVTYVDMNGRFDALGHGISDSDTGDLAESSDGALYSTGVVGIEKGSMGEPGLLSGVIYHGPQSHMGDIEKNANEGISGTINQQFKKQISGKPMEITCRQDVKQRPACIHSNISDELKDYATEIQEVDYSSGHKNKSIIIKVMDPELLELTGEIVQEISGNPVIQDRKLTGAVAHVSMQDASRGYEILTGSVMEH